MTLQGLKAVLEGGVLNWFGPQANSVCKLQWLCVMCLSPPYAIFLKVLFCWVQGPRWIGCSMVIRVFIPPVLVCKVATSLYICPIQKLVFQKKIKRKYKMEGTVFKYFQTGYCKIRVNCRKHHVIEIFHEEHCNKRKCSKRHPKACKHFRNQLACRFGDNCCYKHVTPPNRSDTTNLELNISQLEDCINNMQHK